MTGLTKEPSFRGSWIPVSLSIRLCYNQETPTVICQEGDGESWTNETGRVILR